MIKTEERGLSEIEKLQQKHIERKMLYTHVIWMSIFFLPITPYRHTTLVLGIFIVRDRRHGRHDHCHGPHDHHHVVGKVQDDSQNHSRYLRNRRSYCRLRYSKKTIRLPEFKN